MNEGGHLLASNGGRKNVFPEILPIISIQTVAQGLPIKNINPHGSEVRATFGHGRFALHLGQHRGIFRFFHELSNTTRSVGFQNSQTGGTPRIHR